MIVFIIKTKLVKSPIIVKLVAEVAVLVKMDVIIGRKLSVNRVADGGFS